MLPSLLQPAQWLVPVRAQGSGIRACPLGGCLSPSKADGLWVKGQTFSFFISTHPPQALCCQSLGLQTEFIVCHEQHPVWGDGLAFGATSASSCSGYRLVATNRMLTELNFSRLMEPGGFALWENGHWFSCLHLFPGRPPHCAPWERSRLLDWFSAGWVMCMNTAPLTIPGRGLLSLDLCPLTWPA